MIEYNKLEYTNSISYNNILYNQLYKNSVYDILQSEAWVNFYNTLVNDEDNAPLICKKMCSSSNLAKLRKDFGKAVKISSSSAEVKVEGSINEQ